MEKSGQLEMVALLHNNTIEVYSIIITDKAVESERKTWLTKAGHRTDVRSVKQHVDISTRLFCSVVCG